MGREEKGEVVTWHASRGFGFIRPRDGGDDIFLHASTLGGGDFDIEGEEVYFGSSWDDRKRKYKCDWVELKNSDALKRSARGGGRGRGGRDRDRKRRDSRSRSRGDRRRRSRSDSRRRRSRSGSRRRDRSVSRKRDASPKRSPSRSADSRKETRDRSRSVDSRKETRARSRSVDSRKD